MRIRVGDPGFEKAIPLLDGKKQDYCVEASEEDGFVLCLVRDYSRPSTTGPIETFCVKEDENGWPIEERRTGKVEIRFAE